MNSRFFTLAEAFVAVARHNSITEAAAELRTSKSSISQKVSELEALVDASLLKRTTRKMTLTPAGQKMFETCVNAVDTTAKAAIEAGAVTEPAGPVAGSVTLSGANSYLTRIILPTLPQFLEDFPRVRPILVGSDRRVNFAEENVDLGIRIGPVNSGRNQATALRPLRRILCASPELLHSLGGLPSPDDLADAPCILREQESAEWTMKRGTVTHSHQVSDAKLVVNTIELSHCAARIGLGIALLTEVVVRDDIARGHLINVLPEWVFSDIPVTLLLRRSRMGKTAVRTLHRHLVNKIGVIMP
ncbi:MAG: LysR family transcriptional regulator [Rhodobacteraceae bacterium]|nr:LysR family transcriptional regulator [Paracoccaceae bacterium]